MNCVCKITLMLLLALSVLAVGHESYAHSKQLSDYIEIDGDLPTEQEPCSDETAALNFVYDVIRGDEEMVEPPTGSTGISPGWDGANFRSDRQVQIYINWDGDRNGVHKILGDNSDIKNSFIRQVRRAMQAWLASGINLELTGVYFDDDAYLDSFDKWHRDTDSGWEAIPKNTIYITSSDIDNIVTDKDGNEIGKALGYFTAPDIPFPAASNRAAKGTVSFHRRDIEWHLPPSCESYQLGHQWLYPVLLHELGHALGFDHLRSLNEEGESKQNEELWPHIMNYSVGPFHHQLMHLRGPSPTEKGYLMRGGVGNQAKYGYRDKPLKVAFYEYYAGNDDLWLERFDTLLGIRTNQGADIAYNEPDNDYLVAWSDQDDKIKTGYTGRPDSDGAITASVYEIWGYKDANGRSLRNTYGLSVAMHNEDYAIAFAKEANFPVPHVILSDNESQGYTMIKLGDYRIYGRPGITYNPTVGWLYAANVRGADDDWDNATKVGIWYSETGEHWIGPFFLKISQHPMSGVSVDCYIGICRAVFARLGNENNVYKGNRMVTVEFIMELNTQPPSLPIYIPNVTDVDTHATYSIADPETAAAYASTQQVIKWILAYPKRSTSKYYFRSAIDRGRFSDTRQITPMLNMNSGPGIGMGQHGSKIAAVVPYSVDYPNSRTDNMIQNSYFDDGLNHWFWWNTDGGWAYIYPYQYEAHAEIHDGGYEYWSVGLAQGSLEIESGKTYRVTFDARSAWPRQIQVLLGMSHFPWTPYSNEDIFELDQGMKNYSFEFTMDDPSDNLAQLQFDMGKSSHDVYIDNVKLYEID